MFRFLDLTGQKAATERTIRDKTDPELAANRKDLICRISRPKRILRLQRCDRMNGVRAANCFCAGLRQSQKAHLALAHKLRHRADRFFNRRSRIDAMLIVEIDAIDLQPAQTSFARFLDVIGFAIDSAESWLLGIAQDSKLRREDDLFAMPSQRTADQLFVGVRSINVGGIEKSDAELERARNRSERFFIIAAAIEIRHAHAAETDRRNARSAPSKFSLFHKICAARERHE